MVDITACTRSNAPISTPCMRSRPPPPSPLQLYLLRNDMMGGKPPRVANSVTELPPMLLSLPPTVMLIWREGHGYATCNMRHATCDVQHGSVCVLASMHGTVPSHVLHAVPPCTSSHVAYIQSFMSNSSWSPPPLLLFLPLFPPTHFLSYSLAVVVVVFSCPTVLSVCCSLLSVSAPVLMMWRHSVQRCWVRVGDYETSE